MYTLHSDDRISPPFPSLFPAEGKEGRGAGVTLIELLITLAIGVLLLAGLYHFFLGQQHAYALREEIAVMQQNLRIGIDILAREVRLAGYDPTETAGAGLLTAAPHAIRFTADRNGDGDTDDPNEDVMYLLYDSGKDGDLDLGRNTGGSNQPVVENIQSLDFVYTLRDGSTTTAPADPGQVSMVQIRLTARTAHPDPAYAANGGYRTKTLSTRVRLPNLK
ncbi:MAG: prepilin-type N-terminal cleavage/methylation domain-containing protein [Nitrospinota bacterium]|nr:MAG: prepilin-type N-terminal cleavage/methylation domain-containing protein [Nitrospinota bacterium]